jgi:hypothetical protein
LIGLGFPDFDLISLLAAGGRAMRQRAIYDFGIPLPRDWRRGESEEEAPDGG